MVTFSTADNDSDSPIGNGCNKAFQTIFEPNIQSLKNCKNNLTVQKLYIRFGVQSIKHANVLSEKINFSALGGSKVAIFGGDDLDPIYFLHNIQCAKLVIFGVIGSDERVVPLYINSVFGNDDEDNIGRDVEEEERKRVVINKAAEEDDDDNSDSPNLIA